MNTKEILNLFGSRREVATILGVHRMTVIKWGLQDFIPEWYRPRLAEEARKRGLPLSYDDLLPRHIKDAFMKVEADLANLRGRVEALEHADQSGAP